MITCTSWRFSCTRFFWGGRGWLRRDGREQSALLKKFAWCVFFQINFKINRFKVLKGTTNNFFVWSMIERSGSRGNNFKWAHHGWWLSLESRETHQIRAGNHLCKYITVEKLKLFVFFCFQGDWSRFLTMITMYLKLSPEKSWETYSLAVKSDSRITRIDLAESYGVAWLRKSHSQGDVSRTC